MLRMVIWSHIGLVAKSHLNNLNRMIFFYMKLKEGKGGKLIQDWPHQNLLKITCKRYTICFLSQHSFFFISIRKRVMQVILPWVMDPDFHFSDCLGCKECFTEMLPVSWSILTNAVFGVKVPITTDSFIQLF